MSIERSDKLFEAARDARAKFDYFMLGVIGALCAFIGQSFRPTKLGWNPSTGELGALLTLVASAVAGFWLIDRTNNFFRINAQYLRLQEERGRLTTLMGSAVINEATGEVYSSAEVAAQITALNQKIPMAREALGRMGDATLRAYKVRNSLLLTGFLALLASRVWSAYVTALPATGFSTSPVVTTIAPR